MYTLLYLKWITNKFLLYNTGTSAQCYVAAWMGGEFEGEWIHVYAWLSLFTVHPKQWFSSVQLLNHVPLFATPWTAACQASLSITNSKSLLKLMSIESVMSSNHLILCHSLLLPPSIFPAGSHHGRSHPWQSSCGRGLLSKASELKGLPRLSRASTPKPESVCFTISWLSPTPLILTGG